MITLCEKGSMVMTILYYINLFTTGVEQYSKKNLYITKEETSRAGIGFCFYKKHIDFRPTSWF